MLVEHDGAAESHEETAQGRRLQTSDAADAGAAGDLIDARPGRLIMEGSEAEADIDGALRVGGGCGRENTGGAQQRGQEENGELKSHI